MSSFSQQHQIDPKILAQWTSKKQDRRTVIVFGGLTVFFTILGLLLAIYGARIQEYQVTYSNEVTCTSNSVCTVNLHVEEKMEAPVYVYYRLENFFQNHQRYVASRDDDQLSGTNKPATELENCFPIITNEQAGVTTSVNGDTLVATDPAIPCGLIAHTMFTDEFTLRKQGATSDITIRDTGIAWESDLKDNRYKNIDLTKQWIDMEDERFMNWMRVAGLNDFRKLWGIIDQDVESGDYTVTVNNRRLTSNFDIGTFDTTRIFCLSTVNSFGGENILLAVCYLIAAAISWIILIIFLVRMFRNRKGSKHR